MTATLAPLFILSGPSGSGKSTVLKRVLADAGVPLRLSVSATTRAPRPGEQHGREYYFWTPEQFEAAVKAGNFLEWAKVHGNCYGTLRSEVDPWRRKGMGVALDIDVQGAAQLRPLFPEAVTIFVRTSSEDTYRKRLEARGTETFEAIQRRVQAARCELEQSGEYQYQVINDELETAVAELRAIVRRHFV